ncbi:MAG: YcgL domain-containing protein [Pseudomonadales bacterium]
MKRLVEIFRSPREDGLYLYVDRQEGLQRVPEALLARFGKPESAMVLMLESTRKLARTSASAVLDNIQEQGFYLQMPPLPDSEMFAVRVNNQKLEK